MLPSDDEYDPFPLVDLDPPPITDFEYELGRYKDYRRKHEESSIPPRPSLQFTRDTWWDALLTFYSTEDCSTEVGIITLTPDQRTSTVQHIVSDLRALFHSSIYWVSFINISRFFDSLLTPTRRTSMQPALALSALAVGRFAQSSEAEQGARGRAKALKLLDIAHGALQASMASGWVDIGLIQAAWLIVYFEVQSHPLQSVDRHRSSLLLLDSLIRLFSLTTLDADIKRAAGAGLLPSTTSFPSQEDTGFPTSQPGYLPSTSAMLTGTAAPGYFQTSVGQSFLPPAGQVVVPAEPIVPDHIILGPSTAPPQTSCNCASLCLGHTFPSIRGIAPSWAGTLMWPENVSEGELRKEECRRLVWASVMITASMNSYTSVTEDIERSQLWIKDPGNYAILFPGESLAMSGVPVPAHNIWTLYLRAMLLLHQCVRKRGDMAMDESGRARFAVQAWLEVDALENALNRHTCELERNFGYQAREMLFSARMCMSHEFQQYIPQVTTNGKLFYRDKAEKWLQNRMQMAERVWNNLKAGVDVPALDFRKPLLIYWFMSHVIKALVLWKADNSLTIALHAAKTFVKRTEYLMMFWPSAEQRREWVKLRMQLVEACIKSGVSPPETTIPCPIPRSMQPPS
ncbi:hypothetical protein C8Q80DRAFT_1266219 [Daedaleopsis nitida]|nr:hypothetical protein C8Q80DRAFT_1266219 [Daedaleopsis nitida]